MLLLLYDPLPSPIRPFTGVMFASDVIKKRCIRRLSPGYQFALGFPLGFDTMQKWVSEWRRNECWVRKKRWEPRGHDPVGGACAMTSWIEWVTTRGTLLYDNPPDADVSPIISSRGISSSRVTSSNASSFYAIRSVGPQQGQRRALTHEKG